MHRNAVVTVFDIDNLPTASGDAGRYASHPPSTITMAELTVFYSWQSDLPRKLSRDIVQNAAADAIAKLRVDTSIEDAPRLDHDTIDVAGAPEIARTIFEKIDRCGVFVADLSFVGTTLSDDGNKIKKKLPNPNVLLELGYAVGRIGWERVILVMNTEFGSPEELIFDLRHRRFPITFKLGNRNRHDAKAVQTDLSERIEEAIRATLQNEHSAVHDAISQLNASALQWLHNGGQRDYFSHASRNITTTTDVFEHIQADNALCLLIQLRLLRCHARVGSHGTEYAYHWTYLGHLVLKQLGLR
jgi:hypothetical protein